MIANLCAQQHTVPANAASTPARATILSFQVASSRCYVVQRRQHSAYFEGSAAGHPHNPTTAERWTWVLPVHHRWNRLRPRAAPDIESPCSTTPAVDERGRPPPRSMRGKVTTDVQPGFKTATNSRRGTIQQGCRVVRRSGQARRAHARLYKEQLHHIRKNYTAKKAAGELEMALSIRRSGFSRTLVPESAPVWVCPAWSRWPSPPRGLGCQPCCGLVLHIQRMPNRFRRLPMRLPPSCMGHPLNSGSGRRWRYGS